MTRWLCVSWSAPPWNSSAANRQRRLAVGLQRLGVRVDWVAPDWAACASSRVDRSSVLEGGRTFATGSLDPIWTRARRGGDHGEAASRVPSPWRTFLRLNAFPDPAAPWLPFAVGAIRRAAAHGPYDAVLAAGPPYTAFLAGLAARVWCDAPLVLDYHDLWSASPMPRGAAWRAASRAAERLVLGSAHAAVAVTAGLLERMERDGLPLPARTGVVPLGVDGLLDLPPAPTRPWRLTYAGSLYEGRSLEPLLRALDGCGDDTVLRLVGADGARIEAPPTLRLERRPFASQAELAGEYAESAALLVLLNPDYPEEHTGKLFDYVRTGRPILLLGNPRAAAVELLRELDYPHAAPADEPAAIVAALSGLRAMPGLDREGLRRRALCERFGPEALARALLGVCG